MTLTHHASILAALAILAPAFAALAADEQPIAPEDYARVNAALVETHVLPRYVRLAAATDAFATAAGDLCADGGDTERARARFHNAMAAWMGVRHLRFGPVELYMRAERFYFWPQARGKVADAIDAFLAAAAEAAPPRAPIGQANVAVQGLLAAEALLFADRPARAGSGDMARGCVLLLAVATNMRAMGADVLADWRDGETPFARTVTNPGPPNPYFLDDLEATLAFFRSLYDGLEFVAEVKLRPVVGDAIEEARPHMAETRPSGRSLRNVVDNLEALRALYDGEGGPGLGDLAAIADPDLDELMRKAFRVTLATARSIDRPLEQAAVDPSIRPQAERLTIQVRALTQIVRERLASALALSTGFNALDGD